MNNRIPTEIGRVEKIKIYEVTENELSLLENGFGGSTYLNLAISLLSIGISTIIGFLLAGNNSSISIQVLVYTVTSSSLLTGLIFLYLSTHTKNKTKNTLSLIRARIEADKKKNINSNEIVVGKEVMELITR